MPLTCLVIVPHANVRRKCHLEEGNLTALKNAIAASPGLAGSVDDEDKIEIFDKDFNDYVDLEDGDEIYNMSTIRVLRSCLPALTNQEHGHIQDMSLPGPSAPPMDSAGFGMGSTEHGSFNIMMSDADNHNGDGYSLPDFGAVHALLRPGVPLTSSVHKKIFTILFQSMIKLSITPSRKFYSKVVSLFLQQYPFLADIIGSGDESWITSLKTKFKNERRKMPHDERVMANKLKYSSKRRDASVDGPAELKRRKLHRDNVPTGVHLMEGEDQSSLQAHEGWLIKEDKKEAPDEALIDLRMASTMHNRTAALVRWPVAKSKEKFPYLMDSVRFFNECSRRYGEHPLQGTQVVLRRIRDLAIQGALYCKAELREAVLATDAREDVGPRRKNTSWPYTHSSYCVQL
ncbi:uncharacterized protein LOC135384385 [Ornithodoros turicata]|uniref:uncharacterized protein LOC135384385 n=1 Tax=Ornithodoros turicata TaxID=34597 RepID=UPI003139E9A2